MNSRSSLPDKVRIARSFGKAAPSYDRFAQLQRDVADRLLADMEDLEATGILDLGSGTGYCAERLLSRFPGASVTSLDIAEAMLRHARQKGDRKREFWVCADAEELPFRDNSFDLVVSSLAMQWCPDPGHILGELLRVLKPGGQAFVSTMAENTLAELRASWASVDRYVHVNEFQPCEVIRSAVDDLPFARTSVVNAREEYYYDSLAALTRELKGIGANNLNSGQASGLTGKSKLLKLKSIFEGYRVPGRGIPVTYDLVLMHLQK